MRLQWQGEFVSDQFQIAGRQFSDPRLERRDALPRRTRVQRGVVDSSIDFSAPRVDHRSTQSARSKRRDGFQIRDRDHLFAVGLGQPLHRREPDTHSSERSGAGGGSETVKIFQQEVMVRQQARDLIEEDVSKTFRRVDGDLFDNVLPFGQCDATEFRGHVDGKQPACECPHGWSPKTLSISYTLPLAFIT